MSLDTIRDELRAKCKALDGQGKAAEAARVPQSHVSEVLKGKADPNARLLNWLGWRREAVYLPGANPDDAR